MNRARIRFAATLLGAAVCAGSVAAGQGTQPPTTAPPMTSVLAGKKFTPPIKGEAAVQYTAPVTKREKVSGKDMVVTRITVKNMAVAPIPRLTIAETWYDKGNNVITGGRGVVEGLLQPNEVRTVVIETPWVAGMNANNYNFSHANGTIKPTRVPKLETPPAAPAAKP
jgi:hypothetical protein